MTELAALLASARYLLLDFDGPVCAVYTGLPAHIVARRLRKQLAANGITLPDDGQPSDDPLDIFRQTSQLGPQVTAAIHQLLTSLEVQAIATARPTPGAAELIREARQTGRGVAIVSNNSEAAIHAYLDLHQLAEHVALVLGRHGDDPDLMKPSPYLVRAAVGILDTEGRYCVFVGDSPSDVLAGKLAGVPFIGYAPSPAKTRDLTAAGARTLTASMDQIRTAICGLPPARVAELRRT